MITSWMQHERTGWSIGSFRPSRPGSVRRCASSSGWWVHSWLTLAAGVASKGIYKFLRTSSSWGVLFPGCAFYGWLAFAHTSAIERMLRHLASWHGTISRSNKTQAAQMWHGTHTTLGRRSPHTDVLMFVTSRPILGSALAFAGHCQEEQVLLTPLCSPRPVIPRVVLAALVVHGHSRMVYVSLSPRLFVCSISVAHTCRRDRTWATSM